MGEVIEDISVTSSFFIELQYNKNNMAEEKKTTKKTTTRKPCTKKTTDGVLTNNDVIVTELHAELEKVKAENASLTAALAEQVAKLNDIEKTVKNQYAFVARYDNIQLEGITLNNLKCVIYECDAKSKEDAMSLFDAQLKSTMNIDDSALDKVKTRLFGSKMAIENKIVLKSDISIGELS